MDMKRLGGLFLKELKRQAPEILTGIGVGGFITAIILGISATPTACELIEERKLDERKDELTPKEVVGTVWKCYVPTVVTAAAATACVVGATVTNHKRNAALATAYSLSQETMKIYREKVIETIGEKKEEAIRDEVNKERFNNRDDSPIILTPRGETNCYDTIIKRTYKNDIENVRRGINDVNDILVNEMSATYNDYLESVGLGYWDEIFDDIGWDIDDFPIKPKFTYGPDDNGDPCLIVGFYNEPHAISYRVKR